MKCETLEMIGVCLKFQPSLVLGLMGEDGDGVMQTAVFNCLVKCEATSVRAKAQAVFKKSFDIVEEKFPESDSNVRFFDLLVGMIPEEVEVVPLCEEIFSLLINLIGLVWAFLEKGKEEEEEEDGGNKNTTGRIRQVGAGAPPKITNKSNLILLLAWITEKIKKNDMFETDGRPGSEDNRLIGFMGLADTIFKLFGSELKEKEGLENELLMHLCEVSERSERALRKTRNISSHYETNIIFNFLLVAATQMESSGRLCTSLRK